MYLKSVDLYGFKSFANKMVFKFDKGITAIVGPNGSGKSNVADAIRWVLGEQSAKQLRGAKMEDVIFAGTETRRSLGYCQVDLTIDNHDKKMPIDYSEVTVSRRVYRSGEGEYYINGTQCRLKDVHELFMDTGVGREGYSIIGQGQVDKILSSKPDDRRELFDEAAGIVKYKTRKQAALNKLERSEQDLDRILDIITELEGQKVTLEEQAEVARIFLDKRENLKRYEVHSFIKLIDDFEEKLKDLKAKEEIAKKDLEDKEKVYKEISALHQEYEGQFQEIEEALEKNREEITQTSLRIEKYQSAISLSKEKLKNIDASRMKLKQDTERIENSEIERRQELNDLKAAKAKQEAAILAKEKEIEERQSIFSKTEEEIKGYEEEIRFIQNEQKERITTLTTLQGNIQRSELIIENNSNRIEHLSLRRSIIKQTLVDLGKEIEESGMKLDAIEEENKRLLDDKLLIRKKITKEEEQIAKVKEVLHQKRHEFNKNSSRYEALKDMEEQYEGYNLSVKKIMELKDPGTLGIISELIKVESRYEKAIETALGGALQNIVTTDEAKAKYYIEYLKKHRFGRATFLPLTTVKGEVLSGFSEGEGYLGIASELVDCEEKYRPMIRQLLGRILVVDHLDSGTKLAKKNGQKYRIITLEGDVISAGGAMTGGAFQKEKGQLLSRRNEIESIQTTNETLEKEIAQIEENLLLQEDLVLGLKSEIEEIRNKEQSINIELHTETSMLTNNKNELMKYQKEASQLEAEYQRLVEEKKQHVEQKASFELQLADDDRNNTGSEEKVQDVLEKIAVLKEDKEIVGEEITNDRVTLSSMKQQCVNTQENIERLEENLSSKNETLSEIRREINRLELDQLKEEKALGENQEAQQSSRDELTKLNEQLNELRMNRQDIQVKKGQLDSRKEIAHDEANQLEKEMIRISNQIEKLELLKDTQITYMWDEYEITYTKAKEYEESQSPLTLSDSALRSGITSLKGEIKALGDVNVRAIEEYRSVKERYTFLSEQRDDLLSSKDKLLHIIQELNQQMEEQFREKFNEINLTFNKVFNELFGGGKGYLELTGEEDILTAGINIVAQPPGKKLQNMLLLSGGERAFTAIALLFAIQSLRPSPFCVLDEIEAALDDANVDRFAAYLQRLTDQTQFIVITHRKGTMEAADALYGITMQEKGISTQVSVKLIAEMEDIK